MPASDVHEPAGGEAVDQIAGAPVPLDDLYDRPITSEVLQEATARIMAALTGVLEELRGEQAPTERFDPRRHGITSIGRPKPLEEAS